MSTSPDTHRSSYSNHPPYHGHGHQYATPAPPQQALRLPPIHTLSLPQTPASAPSQPDMPPPASDSWSRSSISTSHPPVTPTNRPLSAVSSEYSNNPLASPYAPRASYSGTSGYSHQPSPAPQPAPVSALASSSNMGVSMCAPSQASYSVGQKRPHPTSARHPPSAPPPPPAPQPTPPPTHQPPSSSYYYGQHHVDAHHAAPPHPHSRPIAPYPTHAPAPAPVPPQQPYYHTQPQQPYPYQSAPSSSYGPPDPYGRAPPPPAPTGYGYPPPPPAHQPAPYNTDYPPYAGWSQPPPPAPTHYAPPPPPQPQHYAHPPPPVMQQAPQPMPTPTPGPSQPAQNGGWAPIAPAPRAAPPPTTAGPDKPIAQVIEHCQTIVHFAQYYTQNASHPGGPSAQETKEMVARAEAVVSILFQLAEEAKPYRKAAADAAKRRKIEETTLGDRTNGTDKEFGLSKEAKIKFFGDNKEAMEQAEKDMKTIKEKRTLSQGGMLPSSKTKYKKRSRATPPGKCHSCFSTETPEWRRGPDGARTLCNACGLHYAKMMKRQGASGQVTIPMLQASAQKSLGETPGPTVKNGLDDAASGHSTLVGGSGSEREKGKLPAIDEDDDGSDEEGSDGSDDDEEEDEIHEEQKVPVSPVLPPAPTANPPYVRITNGWGNAPMIPASSHVRAS